MVAFSCAVALLALVGRVRGADRSIAGQEARQEVKAEHDFAGIANTAVNRRHTRHPDAQWFPEAGLGVLLCWDPCSTRAIGLSWPMIPGRKLVGKQITPAESRQPQPIHGV